MKSYSKALARLISTLVLAFGVLTQNVPGADYPVSLQDSANNTVIVERTPLRVVSLVPSVTDAIYAVGAQESLVGITYHDKQPATDSQVIVGGYFQPSAARIASLQPDMIFVSGIHRQILEIFRESGIILIQFDDRSIDETYRTIECIGKIFDRRQEAADVIAGIKNQIEKVMRKVAQIPESKRKRVMRLMGSNHVMTPGDDSFQNEIIRAAGGIAPRLGKNGAVVTMSREEWQDFNPQLIYYCGREWELSKKYFDQPGWRDVDAVRQKNYVRFPCQLTCRASVHIGDFVEWLAATIYPEEFHSKEANVIKEEEIVARPVELNLDYVKSARIITSIIRDFPHQTLIIDLKEPMAALSSIEGPLSPIQAVGNHYLPPPAWNLGHATPLKELKAIVCGVVGQDADKTTLLFTGANMRNVSVQKQQFRDMVVYALVTAGVETNAVRSGTDSGDFYELGTVNILILTNMQLTPRSMTRAIIDATEAKTAALQDLDIRSCYTPSVQATGTGTDNIIVVEGRGPKIDNAGGHSKLGELISKAVHAGVEEAIGKQNGLHAKRSVFQRMSERKFDLFGITSDCLCGSSDDKQRLATQLEELLLQPQYAGFIESAFTLSDAFEKGLTCDLEAFELMCQDISNRVAGSTVTSRNTYMKQEFAPKVIRMAFDALINGLQNRRSSQEKK